MAIFYSFLPLQFNPISCSPHFNSVSSSHRPLPFLTKPFPESDFLRRFHHFNSAKKLPKSPLFAFSSSSESNLHEHPKPEESTSVSAYPTLDIIKIKRTGGFLDEDDLKKLQILENFCYFHEFDHGVLQVRSMRLEEIDRTVELLADSFADLMWVPYINSPILRLLVRQHLMERRAVLPHAATLVGFYRREGEEFELAGTVEVSFDYRGSTAAPPTPIPPRNSPYICNMSVRKELRRRGIGWHLLKASEELIPQLGTKEVYLHCRKIDTAAFQMYKKASYDIVKTDSFLTLLSFQRRKHLMYKKLPLLANPSEDPTGS